MLDNRAGGLPMDKVAIGQRILEQTNAAVRVVRRLRADVFKDEAERLQTAGADVELGRAVFVQDCRNTCEGWKISKSQTLVLRV